MTSLDHISSEIELAETLIQQIHKSFETLECQCSTIVSLSHQWRNLQTSFVKIQSSLQNRAQELESQEKHLNSIQKSIEDSKKELELTEKQSNSTNNSVCDRCKTLASTNGNVVVKIEPSKKSVADSTINNAIIRFSVTMDGKTLQFFLNDRINEHELIAEDVYNALKLSSDPAKLVLDALDGFFVPKGGLEYDGDVARRSCVLLLEQLLKMKPGIKKTVREEARALACEWREKMRVEGESYLVVLGFLMFLVVFRVSSNFEKDELRRLCGIVHEHRVAGQLRFRLGLLQKRNVSSTAPQVKEEQADTPPVMDVVTSSSIDSSTELHSLFKNTDANGLRSYLEEIVKDQNSFLEKVLNCLRCASDPAKLVLDVVQKFYLQFDDVFEGDTDKECCNFLLEQLMKLSPDITPLVKEAAVNLAAEWKARVIRLGNRPSHVFCFLKFLAAYGLARSFEADELLSLFGTFYSMNDVYKLEQNPSLCRALGLEVKIPDLIQSLIENNRKLEAVRIIYAFNLVTKFPPVPLLKAHLNYIKTTALQTCKNFKNTIKAQNKCANRQILSLQDVIYCILDFKLESEYSPVSLHQRIKQLEEEKIKRNSINQGKWVSNKTSGAQLESKVGMKRSISPTATMANQLQQKRPEKCPNQGEFQNSISSTVSAATTSNTEFLKPASSQPFTVNAMSTWQFGQLPTVPRPHYGGMTLGTLTTVPRPHYGETTLVTLPTVPRPHYGGITLGTLPTVPRPHYSETILGTLPTVPRPHYGETTLGTLPTVDGQFQQFSVNGSGSGLAPNFSSSEFGAVGMSSCSVTPSVNPPVLPYNPRGSLPLMPAHVGNGRPSSSGRHGLQYLYPPNYLV